MRVKAHPSTPGKNNALEGLLLVLQNLDLFNTEFPIKARCRRIH